MSIATIGPDDIVDMDLDDLKQTSKPIDVEADELDFPSMAHHMTVRGKLEALVEKDVLTWSEADEVYDAWQESKN